MNFFVKWLVVIMTTVPCENQGVWDEVTQSYSETQFTTSICMKQDTLSHEKNFIDSLQAIQFFERITKDMRVHEAILLEMYTPYFQDSTMIAPVGGCFPAYDTLRVH